METQRASRTLTEDSQNHSELQNMPGPNRSYDSVQVTDQGHAHLGDTLFTGPVSIQNLVLPTENPSQRRATSGSTQSPRSSTKVQPASFKNSSASVDSTDGVEQMPDREQIVRMNIEKALHFPEEYFRIDDVQPAHHATFSWVFESPDLLDASNLGSWLKHGHGCFWINGKAGSGKSTLMKFLLRNEKTKQYLTHWAGQRALIIAPHFFWHAGTTMQKSLQGVLQSILRQLIESNHDYAQILFPEIFQDAMQFKADDRGEVTEFPEISFTMRQLQNAVDNFLHTPPRNVATLLFIDGVDEYDGDHLWFGKLLVQLSRNQHIKVLVSSRPEPACHYVFSTCPSLRLQDLTGSDIRGYIEDELLNVDSMQQIELLNPGFASQLMVQLTTKASGVFLWVILVVRQLHNGLMNHDEPDTLLKTVDELPERLEALYDHMFSRLPPQYQREGTLLLLITKRAKTAGSKYTALQAFFAGPTTSLKLPHIGSSARSTAAAQQREKALISVLDGRLRSRCCGLLEVRYKDNGVDIEPEVDFLHKTVIDYMDENELWEKAVTRAGLSIRDIDKMLLESCNLAMQHCPWPCLTGPSIRFTQQCFRYGLDWYAGDDECVAESLLKADRLLIQNSIWRPSSEQQSSTYHDFYLQLVMTCVRGGHAQRGQTDEGKTSSGKPTHTAFHKDSKEELVLTSMLPSVCKDTLPVDMTLPMFWIALCGLPYFWRAKLNATECVDRPRLLCLLLTFCVNIDEKSLDRRLNDLSIILPCLDPNTCQQELAIDFPSTPWHQWLLFLNRATSKFLLWPSNPDGTVPYFPSKLLSRAIWQITNILLKAGAETPSRGQAVMEVAKLRETVLALKAAVSTDAALESTLTETLDLLGPAPSSSTGSGGWFRFWS